MFIELIEQLRCLQPHEESWLVASFTAMDGRSVVTGRLGCPVCRAEYPIVDRIGWFGVAPGTPAPAVPPMPDDPEEVLRAAALLGLVGSGGTVLLGGGWGALALPLVALVPVRVALVDPPAQARVEEGTSVLRVADALPLAPGALRAAALDAGTARLLPAVARAVAPGGRLVAPAAVPCPPGLRELVRDDRHWVAEAPAAASRPVPLRRA